MSADTDSWQAFVGKTAVYGARLSFGRRKSDGDAFGVDRARERGTWLTGGCPGPREGDRGGASSEDAARYRTSRHSLWWDDRLGSRARAWSVLNEDDTPCLFPIRARVVAWDVLLLSKRSSRFDGRRAPPCPPAV